MIEQLMAEYLPLTIRSNSPEARKHVKIKIALLDRGFFSGSVIRALQEMNVQFLMPAVLNRRIMHIKRSISSYEMKGVRFNFKVGDYKWATSLRYVPSRLERIYKRRWGIETGYRVKKDFNIKTCIRNPVIRYLFFCVQILMYNIWTNIRRLPDFIKQCGNRVKAMTTRLFKVKILGVP